MAPFGATFSAAWWSRLGGWMLRLFHFLVWWAHIALLYVDDFLFYQTMTSMPLSATMICLICQITNIPVSWSKCELAFSIQWIGWKIHFRSGFIEIPMAKLTKFFGIFAFDWSKLSHIQTKFGKTDWFSTLAYPALALHANLDSSLVS